MHREERGISKGKKNIRLLYRSKSDTNTLERPQRPLVLSSLNSGPETGINLPISDKKNIKNKKVHTRVTATHVDKVYGMVRPGWIEAIRRGNSRQKSTHTHLCGMHLARAWTHKPLSENL